MILFTFLQLAITAPPQEGLTDEQRDDDLRRRKHIARWLHAFHHPDLAHWIVENIGTPDPWIPHAELLSQLIIVEPQSASVLMPVLGEQWVSEHRSMRTIYRWYLEQGNEAAADQAYQWMASRPVHRSEIGYLQDLTDPRIVPILEQAVATSAVGRVRAMAIWGLYYRQLGTPGQDGYLVEARAALDRLRLSSDQTARNFACWALLGLGHADAIEDYADSLTQIPAQWQSESLAWLGQSAGNLSVADIQRLAPLYDAALQRLTGERERDWTRMGQNNLNGTLSDKMQRSQP